MRAGNARSACIAAAVTLMVLATSLAVAQGLITNKRLSSSLAMEAVTDAVDVCRKAGYAVTAIIVDNEGVRQAVLRGDGTAVHTLDSAYVKAYTAASALAVRLAVISITTARLPRWTKSRTGCSSRRCRWEGQRSSTPYLAHPAAKRRVRVALNRWLSRTEGTFQQKTAIQAWKCGNQNAPTILALRTGNQTAFTANTGQETVSKMSWATLPRMSFPTGERLRRPMITRETGSESTMS